MFFPENISIASNSFAYTINIAAHCAIRTTDIFFLYIALAPCIITPIPLAASPTSFARYQI